MDSYKQLPPDTEAKITLPQKHRQTIQGPHEECQRLDAASVAPIHKCPHELLVVIFKLYVSNKPFLIRHLLLVCKTWHAVAVGTPSFWARIFINIDTHKVDAEEVIKALRPHIEASLLRSQPLLLDIRLALRILVPVNALRNRSHVLQFLQSFVGRHGINMVRWKSLDIIFPYYPHDVDLCTSILGLFVGPTPHLTTLSLGVRTLGTLESLNPIFPDLSSLKSLDIESVELLDRINAPFSSLENLSMACSYAVEFQIARLHRFTSLTTLTIGPGFRYYADDSVSTTVALPLLKEIKFREAVPPVQFNLPLLSNLHFEDFYPQFGVELPIMSPRSVSLRSSGEKGRYALEALIRQYGSMETLSVLECMEADLKIIVEDLRREGSLSRTFNLVRVMSDEDQETELRVWRI